MIKKFCGNVTGYVTLYATDVAIATALIHESIHAYSGLKIINRL